MRGWLASTLLAILTALLVLVASPSDAGAQLQTTETFLSLVRLNGTLYDPTTVRGSFRMVVFFRGVSNPTGFMQDDITVTGGVITRFRQVGVRYYVYVDVVGDAGTVTFVVREDAIEEGNPRAEKSIATAPPLTIDLAIDAVAPVRGDFDVTVTFSEPVLVGTGTIETLPETFFLIQDDILVEHGRVSSGTKLSATQWRLTISPSDEFYGTLRVTIPQGSVALLDDDQSFNAAASFDIQVDTVVTDAALAVLSLEDQNDHAASFDPVFSPDHTDYETVVGATPYVTVIAAVRDPGAKFTISHPDAGNDDNFPGHQVSLALGAPTEISVTVTAEDGTTRQTYTVTVVRTTVTLVLTPPRIRENGEATLVTATLDHSLLFESFTVTLEADALPPATGMDFALSDNRTLRFAPNSTTSTGRVTITARNNDAQTPKMVRITGATRGLGVRVIGTTLTIEDDDQTVILTLDPDAVPEDAGAPQTVTVTATLDEPASTRDAPTEVTVSVAGGTATEGTDFTAVPDFTVTIPANER